MPDFDIDRIDIVSGDDNWGPFNRDFAGIIPSGDSLVSVNITIYLGNLTTDDTLSGETNITTEMLETDPVQSISGSILSFYLKYPTAARKGNKATIFYKATLSLQTGVHTVFEQGINIR